ncbi:dual specificity protein phosphatase family protein [Chloroflexia bacterium SDU3-3]|nr:dual specificity protein phosphatase family protein [Chloroflexia bacterium SDU3-3]
MIRPWLAIGSYRDTLNRVRLGQRQIGALLQFAERTSYPHIDYLFLPIKDGEPVAREVLTQGVGFVRAAHGRGLNVMVACGAGISRSATFATAALHEIEGIDLLSAWQAIHRARPITLPHPLLWESLCAYYGHPIPIAQMLRSARYG